MTWYWLDQYLSNQTREIRNGLVYGNGYGYKAALLYFIILLLQIIFIKVKVNSALQ